MHRQMPRVVITGLKQTCLAAPAQWEAVTADDRRPVYVRYRHDMLAAHIGPPGGTINEAVMASPYFYQKYDESRTPLDWQVVQELTGLVELTGNTTTHSFKLFHYCSTHTFLNIIESKTLRIGYAKFMNDTGEMKFSEAAIRSCLDKNPYTKHLVTDGDFFKNSFYPYILCFSKRHDIKEQWEKYADDGRGFAIEFDPNAFSLPAFEPLSSYAELRAQQLHFGYSTVLYKPNEHRELIDATIATYLGESSNPIDRHEFECELFPEIQRLAYRIKSNEFSSEEEIRIILEPMIPTDVRSEIAKLAVKIFNDPNAVEGEDHPLLRPSMRFRSTPSAILPYYELELFPKHLHPIRSVIAGPNNESEIGAIQSLLLKQEYDSVTVTSLKGMLNK